MSKDEVEELIDDAEEVARKIATDSKRDEDEIETAKEVIQFVKDVRKTFIKNGSIHPNTLNSLTRITTGVNSGRFGFMNKNKPHCLITYGTIYDISTSLEFLMSGNLIIKGKKVRCLYVDNLSAFLKTSSYIQFNSS